jgi:hypothetical protein
VSAEKFSWFNCADLYPSIFQTWLRFRDTCDQLGTSY